MRKLGLALTLLVGAAAPAAAQQAKPWTPEIGIRSVFGQLDVDGTNVLLIDFPAGSGIEGFGGNAGLYGVIPVSDRFAIEPSFGLNDISALGTSITSLNAGARVLFSAFGPVYLAAGPSVSVFKIDGEESARWGGQVAAGYRFNVGGSVRARAELFYTSVGEDEDFGFPESSEFGLAIALGMGIDGEARRASGEAMWDLAVGTQGGYTHASFPGFAEITGFSLPGSHGEGSFFGVPISQLAPWFVQIPVGNRIALEPSFSYHSFDVEDSNNASMYALGLRGNYAFNRTFYGALSAEMLGVGGDDFDGVDGVTGIGFAAGARFPLVGALQGRTEISYRTFTGGDDAFLPDHQVTGISFGVIAPLR
jgi:hypothetical protein